MVSFVRRASPNELLVGVELLAANQIVVLNWALNTPTLSMIEFLRGGEACTYVIRMRVRCTVITHLFCFVQLVPQRSKRCSLGIIA